MRNKKPKLISEPRPLCNKCGIRPVKVRGGKQKDQWDTRCRKCSKTKEQERRANLRKYKKKYPWTVFKKDTCEQCGFIPVHKVQLDVDHINGNKADNRIDNLMTLCANCHRLKTFINMEYIKR